MRKVVLGLAAFAAIGLIVPVTSPANAEDAKVIIRDRDHHDRADRDRHHKVVIIKHRRDHRDHGHD